MRDLLDRRPPRKCLFRVDAGRIPGLSFGHLARCLTLSDIFRELYRSENVFLMRGHEDGVRRALQADETIRTLPLASPPIEEWTLVLKEVEAFKPDWMIVDLPYPDLDASSFPYLRSRGVKLFFIDDFRFTDPGVDVFLNSSILAPGRVETSDHGDAHYLLGPEYFIFDDSKTGAPWAGKEGAFNIVLTFGGSDPVDLTREVLKALLNEQWGGVAFRIILGPGYVAPGSIHHLVSGREDAFRVTVNPPEIIPFFQAGDFTVCAGGRTMYELVHLNRKFLPIASTDVEAEAIAEFKRRGFVHYGMTSWRPDAFIHIMKKIVFDPEEKDEARQDENGP